MNQDEFDHITAFAYLSTRVMIYLVLLRTDCFLNIKWSAKFENRYVSKNNYIEIYFLLFRTANLIKINELKINENDSDILKKEFKEICTDLIC